MGEVPTNFHGWVMKPQVLRAGPSSRRGRKKKYPRLARRRPSSEVQNLLRYSPKFRTQRWQRYRSKDTDRGPEVWEVKWAVFWRKGGNGLPGRRHCSIVARNVLTSAVKYFVSNRVPGEGGITLRRLLRVAFGRWSVERRTKQTTPQGGGGSALGEASIIDVTALLKLAAWCRQRLDAPSGGTACPTSPDAPHPPAPEGDQTAAGLGSPASRPTAATPRTPRPTPRPTPRGQRPQGGRP